MTNSNPVYLLFPSRHSKPIYRLLALLNKRMKQSTTNIRALPEPHQHATMMPAPRRSHGSVSGLHPHKFFVTSGALAMSCSACCHHQVSVLSTKAQPCSTQCDGCMLVVRSALNTKPTPMALPRACVTYTGVSNVFANLSFDASMGMTCKMGKSTTSTCAGDTIHKVRQQHRAPPPPPPPAPPPPNLRKPHKIKSCRRVLLHKTHWSTHKKKSTELRCTLGSCRRKHDLA